ncbi:hypothetical protein M422DRAFT_50105 [Sphaerobolus stellatus SS14]|uniref:Uncharacterized protein n=1 Tax=Sphaerobolus stellatus (strain SS14) TaxID=990650 RepID=A0A0C9VKY1_SPHS4|nr:hypothetical protein M422DRAFT_50105 [Sphaerobolus stellatus SS14]
MATFMVGVFRELSPFQTGLTLLVRPSAKKVLSQALTAIEYFQRVLQPLLIKIPHWRHRPVWCCRTVNDPESMVGDSIPVQTIIHDIGFPMSGGGRTLKYEPTMDILAEHELLMWTIQNTTDPDTITLAAEVIPFVFWPRDVNIATVLIQLQYTFDGCFDGRWDIIPGSEARARACYIAVLYLQCSHGFLLGGSHIQYAKEWLRKHVFLVKANIQDYQAMQIVHHHLDNWRGPLDLKPPDPLPPSHLNDMVWSFRLLNNYLSRRRNPDQNGIKYAQSVIAYYASTAWKYSTSQLLLCVAMVYGFQPDVNFLELPDKSAFESDLLDEVLARRSKHAEDPNWYFIHSQVVPWHEILPGLSSLIERLIPSNFSVRREYMPTVSWLSMLREDRQYGRHWRVHLDILKNMVLLNEEKPDYGRLLKFYDAFGSQVEILIEDAYLIFEVLEALEVQSVWSNNDVSSLLLALGIVKWPQSLPPNELYVNILISSLEASTPVGIREVALQAAWCSRNQLVHLTDTSRTRLLSALIAATPLGNTHTFSDLSFSRRFTQCFDLIFSLCKGSAWECPFEYQEIPMASFMGTVVDITRTVRSLGWTSSAIGAILANTLGMLQALKEVSGFSSSRETAERGDQTTLILAWRYLSSLRERHLDVEDEKVRSKRNNPFDLITNQVWDVGFWRPICYWSTVTFKGSELDEGSLRELIRHVQNNCDHAESKWVECEEEPNWVKEPIRRVIDELEGLEITLREALLKKDSRTSECRILQLY